MTASSLTSPTADASAPTSARVNGRRSRNSTWKNKVTKREQHTTWHPCEDARVGHAKGQAAEFELMGRFNQLHTSHLQTSTSTPKGGILYGLFELPRPEPS